MNSNSLDKQAKISLYLLTLLFLIAEVIFSITVIQIGNEDIFGLVSKTIIFSIFIFLVFKKYNWAKWVLSIGLILLGILCLIGGFDGESLSLKLLAIFYIYFGAILHFSKPFKNYFEPIQNLKKKKVSEISEVEEIEKTFEYPLLVKRYQAVFIDGMLILISISIAAIAFDQFDSIPLYLKVLCGILIISYEPIFTAYKSTLGQFIINIRVRQSENPEKKINLIQAYSRILVKGFLGWLSFITINFNSEHKAIHDYVASTVVIKKRKTVQNNGE